MSKVVNMVGGGAKPRILLTVVGQKANTTMSAPSTTWAIFDSHYFKKDTDYDDYAHYVCQKAGTYVIRISCRGAYAQNTSTRTNVTVRLYINGAYGTRTITSDSGSYTTAEYIVTLAVGDKIALNAALSSGTVLCPVNMMIYQ